MSASCRCVDKVSKLLAEQNERMELAFRMIKKRTGNARTLMASPIIATAKRDPSLRTKRRSLVASYCPFCGNKYPSEETGR